MFEILLFLCVICICIQGIWRIPSSEIDRPGSFSAHLSKCISILMEVLRLSGDRQTLVEITLQLYRNPESDK